jgi:2-amino-4-hydroxy-6-hydroxymethyldihydropteridine diphosphokinase
VYLGIGSNVQPQLNVPAAVTDLRACFGALQLSPVYRSAAVGFVGDDFYNMVVGLDTALDVYAVARVSHEIEQRHGRVRGSAKFTSRTLDIDLLLYGQRVIQEPGLQLPRAEITRYAYVLRPLADLAPSLRHPVLGTTMAELWAAFDASHQQLQELALVL